MVDAGRDSGQGPCHRRGGGDRLGRMRDQGAPARRPDHPGGLRGALSFALPVLYDVMGDTSDRRACRGRIPASRVHNSAPWQLRRRLAGPAGDDRRARAASERLHRHLGCPQVRSAGRGRAAGRPEKVLFGTDGPWLHPGVELSKVLALGLPARHQHLVLAGNWLRLTAAARTRARSRLRAAGPAPARVTSGRSAPNIWSSSTDALRYPIGPIRGSPISLPGANRLVAVAPG